MKTMLLITGLVLLLEGGIYFLRQPRLQQLQTATIPVIAPAPVNSIDPSAPAKPTFNIEDYLLAHQGT